MTLTHAIADQDLTALPATLLDHHGDWHEHPELDKLADRSEKFLSTAYRHMVRTRAFDDEATSLQRQGELALWPPCQGQEGIQVGSALATPREDFVVPSYREHGVADVRGLALEKLIGVFRGVHHGGWDSASHNFHIYTFVIAAHLPHAVGRAMALQQDRRRVLATDARSVVTYFGDGSTSQGDANEALVFAASAKAPVVFICQNNGWAISVPTAVQSVVPIVQRPGGFGIPALRVDGNDPVASFAATKLALEHVHSGRGPFFIEAVTYRMGAHTTSDDPTRYRTDAEESYWAERCPIARTEKALRRHYGVGDEFFADVAADADALRRRVREYTRSLSAGDVEQMFDHVYASDHLQVEADRRTWRADGAAIDALAKEAGR
ncbi:thiamine pyrophosphate-dependent enzyme [Bowdeniella nasicola]|uniref:thiamine pyrophosphate-dependent enzyme n=1 Tax=Bowdeniella nasicola TaxID=208480 RepID=UPI0009F8562F|nr:thiamine pyrophosphate-dependent enzyme [Bowdeniella nasicola]